MRRSRTDVIQVKSKLLNKFSSLGWLVCFALIGLISGSGFQVTTEKTAVVNLEKAINESEQGKKNLAEFDEMKAARNGLLQFIGTNQVVSTEQAQKLRTLWLKIGATEAEKQELERIKADVAGSAKKWQELSGKQNLTPDEKSLLDDFEGRRRAMDSTLQQWYRQFTDEMETWTAGRSKASADKAKAALNNIAKTQGYTLVFGTAVAPFGANDLTQAVTQALNAQP